jgi:hypothetical protein
MSECRHVTLMYMRYSCCCKFDTLESRSELPRTFGKVALEKNWDYLERWCEKWRSTAQSQRGKAYPNTIKRRKANWIGHILCGNCLLKQVSKVKIAGRIEVTGIRRCKLLLDDLKETRGYWKLKAEALDDGIIWRTRFARGFAPVS